MENLVRKTKEQYQDWQIDLDLEETAELSLF